MSSKKSILRVTAAFLAVNMIAQIFAPAVSYALTSGPSQPEVQSFEPIGTTDMVDLFSGDFTYNIPLFELPGPNGGYPFNLIYNAGVTMDQEASWVGLGWNVNPGAITRQMRGLPDEFNGESILKEQDIRTNVTFGVNAGVGLELFGADPLKGTSGNPSLSLGVRIYYNNYRGVGYALETGASVTTSQNSSGMAAGLGINMSMDSQEGIGLNPSLSITKKHGDAKNSYNVGLGYNSNAGLTSLSTGYSASSSKTSRYKDGKVTSADRQSASFGGTSSLSVASVAFTPTMAMPMKGRNLDVQVKFGGHAFGIFGNLYVGGFFNTNYIKDKSTTVKGYGYNNLNNSGDGDLLDYNREKDGPIRSNTPNLAMPSMTYDIYSVTGHGVAGMFRPYRYDIGVLHDNATSSDIAGGSVGVDLGTGNLAHFGVNAAFNYSKTKTGVWSDYNDFKGGQGAFGRYQNQPGYEQFYFKAHGEYTSTDSTVLKAYNGDAPLSIDLTAQNGVKTNFKAENKFKQTSTTAGIPFTRQSRNQVSGYINGIPDSGIYTITPDGMRYEYARVARNTKQVECQFSVDISATTCDNKIDIDKNGGRPDYKRGNNTDKYLSRTEYPAFAYAHLLTAVYGSDYVDVDGDGKPSDADLGYWVKFTYTKKETAYKWKAPYNGANYMRGSNTTKEDDKGSYIYGEKEVYYLSSAETRTHKADFTVSVRKDGRGVNEEMHNTDNGITSSSGFQYKLDKITLYTKNGGSGTPIKTVNFAYNYDLCGKVENNDGTTAGLYNGVEANAKRGKLTLKKVWFTYQNSTRGALSPYVFNYNETDPTENPDYNPYAYDRWGNYKSDTGVFCNKVEMPYVNQLRARSEVDKNMACWNLKGIRLPSGANMTITYEADDYGYVQNKIAGQMFRIASLSSGNTSNNTINHERWAGDEQRRVYFALETAISDSDVNKTKKLNAYFDGISKLYYRVKMKLRTGRETPEDFISGYADIAGWGFDENSKSGNNYTRAYVTMGRPKVGSRTSPFHNFSLAAWQHLRVNQPQLSGAGPMTADPNSNAGAAAAKVQSLVSIVPSVVKMFTGFNEFAYLNQWATTIDLNASVIRLNTPDKIKYGGGCRVKKIEMDDNWITSSTEKSSTYGQVYDYTMSQDGQTISSGVAIYEPTIGGDEIPLRVPKDYTENIPLKTDNALFFEYPINESYFPGPGVGYRRVSVSSLATAGVVAADPKFPVGLKATGQTVHEFYTAKDFPVITGETGIEIREYKLLVPIPLLGQISVHELTASQGYSIVLNDMHGKPKKVTTYAQAGATKAGNQPISWVSYTYNAEEVKVDGNPDHSYYKLKNTLPTLVSDDMGSNVVTKRRTIGEEFEIFSDMRESSTESVNGGLCINADMMLFGIIPAVFPIPWPNVGYAGIKCRTAVVNKVIHRAGIVTQTQAYNEGSLLTTSNLLFDDQTGRAVLTQVNNNYNKPIYNYDIPAPKAYDAMGGAYENAGNQITATIASGQNISTNPFSAYKATVTGGADAISKMRIGDEYTYVGADSKLGKLTYAGIISSDYYFTKAGTAPSGTLPLTLLRSGKRNHLSASVGKITTLSDPTKVTNRGTAVNCTTKVDVPMLGTMTRPVLDMDLVTPLTDLFNTLLDNDVNANGIKDYYDNSVDVFLYPIYNQYYKQVISVLEQRQSPVITTLTVAGQKVLKLAPVHDPNFLPIYYNTVTGLFYQNATLSLPARIWVGDGDVIAENDSTSTSSNHTLWFWSMDGRGATGTGFWVDKHSILKSAILAGKNGSEPISEIYFITAPDLSKYTFAMKYVMSDGSTITSTSTVGFTTILFSLNLIKLIYNYEIVETPIIQKTTPINNVLSTSAGTQADGTLLTDGILGTFDTGVKGIWRADANYAYVDDRKQTASVLLSQDGVMDNVGLFNWKYANNDACNGWRKVNTITAYNRQSFETENKDILGRYSAALYGYSGNLSTAVATNTAYNELGFDGFEEYVAAATVKPKDVTGNLIFTTGTSAPLTTDYNSKQDRYDVTGKGCKVLIPKAFDEGLIGKRVFVSGATMSKYNDKNSIYGNFSISGVAAVTGQDSKSVLELNASECKIPSDSVWQGKVGIITQTTMRNAPVSSVSGSLAISAVKAHTGKQSLSSNGTAAFEQMNMRFTPGKRYVISGWVSRAGSQAATYADGNTKLGIVLMNSNLGNTDVLFQPTGDVIEGWQKVEGEFTIPTDGTTKVQMKLQSTGMTSYFDDIRIFPSEGNMQSYVYDPATLKLSATLDNNNYATLYYYDEQGNLFLIKKETERGIQTVQESFGHNIETYAK